MNTAVLEKGKAIEFKVLEKVRCEIDRYDTSALAATLTTTNLTIIDG